MFKGQNPSVHKSISKEGPEKPLYEDEKFDVSTLKTALLVGVYRSGESKELCMEHLEELSSLAATYGFETLEMQACPIKKLDAKTYIGKGKVEELARLASEKNIDVIIFDDEISPNQQRNVEKVFARPVLDRTELILEVFAQRAHTKEARLQVELATVRYQLPRLKRLWTHLSRQKTGGKGYLKGEGEKQIEIDRRLLRRRISSLEKELEVVRSQRDTQRRARLRSGTPTFAIVGYTNAGKSTLLKALTQADVFVEDKLFATLDTTSRQFVLPNHQKIILIDTVGFIRKLPHTVVAAFRSTLEEALYTDILLHLIDAEHPSAFEHAEATYEVLKELGVKDKPIITVLNKIDVCENKARLNQFRVKYPKTVRISALNREGFDDLMQIMEDELSSLRRIVKLRIPQSYYKVATELMKEGRVISSEYEENDIIMEVEISKELEAKVKPFML